MLDDLKYIHEKDREDALGIAERQNKQLTHDFGDVDLQFTDILNVVFAGMGGSALPAQIIKCWPALAVPFEIVRDYDMPFYVGERTLVIVASYSGNTEETIEALAQAKAKGAQIAVLSSGGKLQELAEAGGHPFMLIPKADQPRYAVFAMFKASLDILQAAELIRAEEVNGQLHAAQKFVAEAVQGWRAEVPTAHNPAKQLAQEIIGKSLVVYAGPKLFAAAYKWKISCNENAKQVAWCGQLPEFNHNEFIGWSEQPRVQKRFEVSERLLSGMRPAPHIVEVQGDTHLKQLLWAITFGDFVTLYLGILNGLDPAPVVLVEKLKKVLSE
jgi:glucose/mannose-6-phosphate isomerase